MKRNTNKIYKLKIKEALKFKNISIRTLSEKIGCSNQYLGRVLSCPEPLPARFNLPIEKELGIKITR